jgi:hypothetical protein
MFEIITRLLEGGVDIMQCVRNAFYMRIFSRAV